MRKKLIEKITKSTTYIAFDDTTFDSWDKCEEYEASKRDKVVSNFTKLIVGTASECDIYNTGDGEEGCIVAFIPQSDDDIRFVKEYSFLVDGTPPDDLMKKRLYYAYVGYNYETYIHLGTEGDILRKISLNLEQMIKEDL